MKRYDAVIAGYTCIDMIPEFNNTRSEKSASDFFAPGKLIEIEGADFVLGGAVPNTGLAMKKFGKKVFLNGLIGHDHMGDIAEMILTECGAFEGMSKTDQTSTAFSIVLSPPGIDRIFLESPGCNHIFNIDDINFEAIADARLFHFGYPPLLRQFFVNKGSQLAQLFSKIQDIGGITSLDFSLPDPESESGKTDWSEILKKTLPFVDIFTPSIEEAVRIMRPEEYNAIKSTLQSNEDITGAIPMELIAEISGQIIGLGVDILLIKAGKHGLYLFTGDGASIGAKLGHKPDERWNNRKILCKAYHAEPDKIVNASGAGDTAIAAFLTAILNGETPEIALKYAAMAGRNNLYCKDIYHDLKDWGEMTEAIGSEPGGIMELSGITYLKKWMIY